ncbi:hypothetical protein PLESTB_001555200 [Pleodorina starrii]|uniref:Uncharacterized protein n=1 Tax=Pleodorina starrii TaxID=330485 RepID=A0A9W6BXZ7_9CHLO|nr:hypothetical protein PLESTB_001555200 [Pleodorina starrii]
MALERKYYQRHISCRARLKHRNKRRLFQKRLRREEEAQQQQQQQQQAGQGGAETGTNGATDGHPTSDAVGTSAAAAAAPSARGRGRKGSHRGRRRASSDDAFASVAAAAKAGVKVIAAMGVGEEPGDDEGDEGASNKHRQRRRAAAAAPPPPGGVGALSDASGPPGSRRGLAVVSGLGGDGQGGGGADAAAAAAFGGGSEGHDMPHLSGAGMELLFQSEARVQSPFCGRLDAAAPAPARPLPLALQHAPPSWAQSLAANTGGAAAAAAFEARRPPGLPPPPLPPPLRLDDPELSMGRQPWARPLDLNLNLDLQTHALRGTLSGRDFLAGGGGGGSARLDGHGLVSLVPELPVTRAVTQSTASMLLMIEEELAQEGRGFSWGRSSAGQLNSTAAQHHHQQQYQQYQQQQYQQQLKQEHASLPQGFVGAAVSAAAMAEAEQGTFWEPPQRQQEQRRYPAEEDCDPESWEAELALRQRLQQQQVQLQWAEQRQQQQQRDSQRRSLQGLVGQQPSQHRPQEQQQEQQQRSAVGVDLQTGFPRRWVSEQGRPGPAPRPSDEAPEAAQWRLGLGAELPAGAGGLPHRALHRTQRPGGGDGASAPELSSLPRSEGRSRSVVAALDLGLPGPADLRHRQQQQEQQQRQQQLQQQLRQELLLRQRAQRLWEVQQQQQQLGERQPASPPAQLLQRQQQQHPLQLRAVQQLQAVEQQQQRQQQLSGQVSPGADMQPQQQAAIPAKAWSCDLRLLSTHGSLDQRQQPQQQQQQLQQCSSELAFTLHRPAGRSAASCEFGGGALPQLAPGDGAWPYSEVEPWQQRVARSRTAPAGIFPMGPNEPPWPPYDGSCGGGGAHGNAQDGA